MVQWLGLRTSTLRDTGSKGLCIPWSVTKKKKKQFVLYNLIDKLKNRKNWDFPGDPVAKIQCYQCRGPKFDRSLIRELDPT